MKAKRKIYKTKYNTKITQSLSDTFTQRLIPKAHETVKTLNLESPLKWAPERDPGKVRYPS